MMYDESSAKQASYRGLHEDSNLSVITQVTLVINDNYLWLINLLTPCNSALLLQGNSAGHTGKLYYDKAFQITYLTYFECLCFEL